MLKILQARLQQYVNWELPDVLWKSTSVFRKGSGNIKLPSSVRSWKMQENFRKASTSASLTALKPLTVWITTNCGKLFKRWEYQNTLPASLEICMLVKKQQLELDMEQWTGSKLGKEYIKAVYLTYIQNTSCEMGTGWSPSWNQDCRKKYE